MKVWEALARKHPVVTIAPKETVAVAIRSLVNERVHALPVVDQSRLVGIVTTGDILWNLDDRGAVALDETVDRVMTRDPVTVNQESRLVEIEEIFLEHTFSHLPVLEDGKLVGILTPADVFGSQLGDASWLNEHLHSLLHGG